MATVYSTWPDSHGMTPPSVLIHSITQGPNPSDCKIDSPCFDTRCRVQATPLQRAYKF